MQKIITATGKEFDIQWCGRSTIDFALRFAVKGSDMATVLNTFTKPEETALLIHIIDAMNNKAEYRGFTTFKGVDLHPDGSIIVSLMESI